jgi:hypothetical protein
MKLSACLLVKEPYLLVTLGPTASTADSFGQGPSLATRPELKPLAKFADKPLIEINYVSQAFGASVATTGEDVRDLVDVAKKGLEAAQVSEARRNAIVKDLEQLAKEMSEMLPRPSATFSCAFTTPRGHETYSYNYGPSPAGEFKASTIAEHLGGTPLVAVAGVASDPTPQYRTMVRWLKVIYGHADAVLQEMAGDDVHKQFQGGMAIAKPFLERLDSITGTQLLPAIGTGEWAFVIDGKWTSREWFPGLDQGNTVLPLFEIGTVRTVKDSEQLLKALSDYRTLGTDVLAKAREMAPVPEGGVPAPEAKKTATGTAYFWPLPQMGQDQQIQPNLGLSDKLLVKSLSLRHTDRLLTPTSLSTMGGLLESNRSLMMLSAVDFAGIVETARPWIEKFAVPAILEEVPDDAPPGLTRQEIPDQIRKVLDVLKCLRGFRSVTYREGDATVTHGETVIQDLK